MDDDWARCDAEAVVAALSVRYHFSRANAVQLLRDEGILRPRAEAEHEADDEGGKAECLHGGMAGGSGGDGVEAEGGVSVCTGDCRNLHPIGSFELWFAPWIFARERENKR